MNALSLETRIDLYEGVMTRYRDEHDLRGPGPFIVRQWDGVDGTWTDCTAPVDAAEALRVWEEHTDGGTKNTSFDAIDYYRIFPADISMVYSGGREMFRPDEDGGEDDGEEEDPYALPEDELCALEKQGHTAEGAHAIVFPEVRLGIGRRAMVQVALGPGPWKAYAIDIPSDVAMRVLLLSVRVDHRQIAFLELMNVSNAPLLTVASICGRSAEAGAVETKANTWLEDLLQATGDGSDRTEGGR